MVVGIPRNDCVRTQSTAKTMDRRAVLFLCTSCFVGDVLCICFSQKATDYKRQQLPLKAQQYLSQYWLSGPLCTGSRAVRYWLALVQPLSVPLTAGANTIQSSSPQGRGCSGDWTGGPLSGPQKCNICQQRPHSLSPLSNQHTIST